MEDGGYKIRNQEAIHFITFAVVGWVDVFTRKDYRDILLDSVRFCQAEKQLAIHAWCIMSNHVHFILSARQGNLSDVVRDFKKFTSQKLVKAIADNKQESRREWMLDIFAKEGESNARNVRCQFWRQDNRPIELYSSKFIFQRMNYIHNNAVEAGLVTQAEHYVYSSAKDYVLQERCGLLEVVFL